MKVALAILRRSMPAPVAVDDGAIQVEIDRRLALIRDKNWAEADRIRDELLARASS